MFNIRAAKQRNFFYTLSNVTQLEAVEDPQRTNPYSRIGRTRRQFFYRSKQLEFRRDMFNKI